MGFFKQLFGGSAHENSQNEQQDTAHDFEILKYDGVRAMNIGQLDYAIKCFEKALEIHEDLEIHDYLSQIYIRTDKMTEALDHLSILHEAQPDNIRILLRMAKIYYMNEDYDHMAEVCEKAKALDAENAQAAYELARAMRGKEDMIQAIAQITQCITLCEKAGEEQTGLLKDAMLLRGTLLLKMGDKNGAEADANWLGEHDGDSEDAMMFKARVQQALGYNEEALKSFDKVISLNPFSVEAFRERGQLKLTMGDKQGAEEDMKNVLELDPDTAQGVNGNFEAVGHEDIQQQVEQAYKSINPLQ